MENNLLKINSHLVQLVETYIKPYMNQDDGLNLTEFFKHLNNLTPSDYNQLATLLDVIEQNNLFFSNSQNWNNQFKDYVQFFELIKQTKVNYASFLSDLTANDSRAQYTLNDFVFDLIIKSNGRLITILISELIKTNQFFQNDEQTTIKILNLDIDPTIKKQYIKFNQTPIKATYLIEDKDVRIDYFREMIKRKFSTFKVLQKG